MDDDEDIFGDAGTNYTPELPVPKAANGHAPAPTAGSYFEKKDEMTDLPALPKAGHLCFHIISAKGCILPPSSSALQMLIAWGRCILPGIIADETMGHHVSGCQHLCT